MKKTENISRDKKAPKLLDLVLLAGEKQPAELLPLEADDETGHQGGQESHQDAQRQVPAVCSEGNKTINMLGGNLCGGSPGFRPQDGTNSTPLWYQSMASALQLCRRLSFNDQTMSCAGLPGWKWETSASVCKHLSYYLSKSGLKIATLPLISHFLMPRLDLMSFIFLLSSRLCFQSDTTKLYGVGSSCSDLLVEPRGHTPDS